MSKVSFRERNNPSTPSSGIVNVFIDTSGNLCWQDDTGKIGKLATAGSFTLTIPATGTAALLDVAQTFSAAQTFSSVLTAPGMKPASDSTTAIQLQRANGTAIFTLDTTNQRATINITGSAEALRIQRSGVDALQLFANADSRGLIVTTFDNAASYGPFVSIGRNSNSSTPAGGHILMRNRSNAFHSIWVDDADQLRIWKSNQPTNATDTSGTVVGTQTSSLDSKSITGDPVDADAVMAAVQQGAEAVRRFTYRSGAFNNQEFSGVVVDYAPRYGMDADAEHPAGKSLNVVTVIGDLLMAVAHLAKRVEALEAQ